MRVYPGARRVKFWEPRWQVKPLSRIFISCLWDTRPATIVEFAEQKCADWELSKKKAWVACVCDDDLNESCVRESVNEIFKPRSIIISRMTLELIQRQRECKNIISWSIHGDSIICSEQGKIYFHSWKDKRSACWARRHQHLLKITWAKILFLWENAAEKTGLFVLSERALSNTGKLVPMHGRNFSKESPIHRRINK